MMYEPEDDSLMLSDVLKCFFEKNKSEKFDLCIDMGCGTGIQGFVMEPFCSNVLFVDINQESVDYVSNLVKGKFDDKCLVVKSDLFESVPDKFKGQVDVIVFNPPYLPREEHEVDDVELTGGVSGVDVTSKFIVESKSFLKKSGRLFFVVSSLSDVSFLNSLLKREGFSFDVVKSDHFFFEDIMVYEAWLDDK